MSDPNVINSVPAALTADQRLLEEPNLATECSSASSSAEGYLMYRIIWYATNVLLLASMFLVFYTVAWDYSTRRYLTGFSDAVVPAGAAIEEKIVAILAWMSGGPARRADPISLVENRDPTDTLNYKSLLQVCGSATNAFINLADSSGLVARRLLLLDSAGGTRHVVAEVMLDGRWIVVDPSFRVMLRGASGQFLTRRDLADPEVFSIATRNVRNYDPSYNYAHTEHIRLERVAFVGPSVRRILNFLLPSWEASPTLSLLVERESFAAEVASLLMFVFLVLSRISLRWFGESRLGFRTTHIRERMRRAAHAFLTLPS
jgi:hypothetical protein